MKVSLTTKYVCLVLVSTLTSQAVFGSLAESNLWKERQTSHKRDAKSQLAALPSARFLPPFNLPAFSEKLSPRCLNKQFSRDIPLRLKDLADAIPQSLASIQETYYSESQQTNPVILLQDVHLNHEAQSNIAGVLQALISSEKISGVGVEGAFGPFDFRKFRSLPNKKVVKQVADDFLQKNLVAAPAYVGITSPSEPPDFIGIDDEESYRANVDAYLTATSFHAAVEDDLTTYQSEMAARKKMVFSPALYDFDTSRNSYQKGIIGLGAYLRKLSRYEVDQPWVIRQFLEALTLESAIDFNRLEQERNDVLGQLVQKLNKQALLESVELGFSYRMGQIGFGDYYRHFQHLCASNGIVLRNTPVFDNYISYLLLSDGIQGIQLFHAVEQLEKSITEKLISRPVERELLEKSEYLALVSKLVDFSLTSDEWEKYKRLRSAPVVSFQSLNFSPFEKFYEEADVRSKRMIENAQLRGTTALVIGGFHSLAMTKMLRKQKISYLVVSPKLTKMEEEKGTSYLSIFSREKTPLDKLFAGEKLFLAPRFGALGTGQSTAEPEITDNENIFAGVAKTESRAAHDGLPDVLTEKLSWDDNEFRFEHGETASTGLVIVHTRVTRLKTAWKYLKGLKTRFTNWAHGGYLAEQIVRFVLRFIGFGITQKDNRNLETHSDRSTTAKRPSSKNESEREEFHRKLLDDGTAMHALVSIKTPRNVGSGFIFAEDSEYFYVLTTSRVVGEEFVVKVKGITSGSAEVDGYVAARRINDTSAENDVAILGIRRELCLRSGMTPKILPIYIPQNPKELEGQWAAISSGQYRGVRKPGLLVHDNSNNFVLVSDDTQEGDRGSPIIALHEGKLCVVAVHQGRNKESVVAINGFSNWLTEIGNAELLLPGYPLKKKKRFVTTNLKVLKPALAAFEATLTKSDQQPRKGLSFGFARAQLGMGKTFFRDATHPDFLAALPTANYVRITIRAEEGKDLTNLQAFAVLFRGKTKKTGNHELAGREVTVAAGYVFRRSKAGWVVEANEMIATGVKVRSGHNFIEIQIPMVDKRPYLPTTLTALRIHSGKEAGNISLRENKSNFKIDPRVDLLVTPVDDVHPPKPNSLSRMPTFKVIASFLFFGALLQSLLLGIFSPLNTHGANQLFLPRTNIVASATNQDIATRIYGIVDQIREFPRYRKDGQLVISSSHESTRLTIVENLKDLGPAALPIVTRLASDFNPMVRQTILQVLAHYPSATTVDVLVNALGDEEYSVRHQAKELLVRMPNAQTASAVERIKDQLAKNPAHGDLIEILEAWGATPSDQSDAEIRAEFQSMSLRISPATSFYFETNGEPEAIYDIRYFIESVLALADQSPQTILRNHMYGIAEAWQKKLYKVKGADSFKNSDLVRRELAKVAPREPQEGIIDALAFLWIYDFESFKAAGESNRTIDFADMASDNNAYRPLVYKTEQKWILNRKNVGNAPIMASELFYLLHGDDLLKQRNFLLNFGLSLKAGPDALSNEMKRIAANNRALIAFRALFVIVFSGIFYIVLIGLHRTFGYRLGQRRPRALIHEIDRNEEEAEQEATLLADILVLLSEEKTAAALSLLQGAVHLEVERTQTLRIDFFKKWDSLSKDPRFLFLLRTKLQGRIKPNAVYENDLLAVVLKAAGLSSHEFLKFFSGPNAQLPHVFVLSGQESPALVMAAIIASGGSRSIHLIIPSEKEVETKFVDIMHSLKGVGRNVTLVGYKSARWAGLKQKKERGIVTRKFTFEPANVAKRYLPKGYKPENVTFILGDNIEYEGKSERVIKFKDLIPVEMREYLDQIEKMVKRILAAA